MNTEQNEDRKENLFRAKTSGVLIEFAQTLIFHAKEECDPELLISILTGALTLAGYLHVKKEKRKEFIESILDNMNLNFENFDIINENKKKLPNDK